jgi:hypothetical protein
MKRLTFFSKLILFLTSYLPLGIICLIIDFEGTTFPFFAHHYYSLILLALIILFPILLFSMIRYFLKRPAGWEKMKIVAGSVENMDREILAYIFSYILPFLGFPEERRILVAVFLLFIVGILYTRSDMIGINPLLAIFGYHIVRTKWDKDNGGKPTRAILISRSDYYQIERSGTIDAIQIHNELYIVKGGES